MTSIGAQKTKVAGWTAVVLQKSTAWHSQVSGRDRFRGTEGDLYLPEPEE